MTTVEIQNTLKHHEYMWSVDGPTWGTGDAIGYAKIPRREPGQEIWVHNDGVERPDYQYVICRPDRKLFCINRHFRTPEAALIHAKEWRAASLPLLRLFEWYDGHYAYTVDGLTDSEVLVVETTPGQWRMRTTLDNGSSFWHDAVWSSPENALRV